MNQVDTINTMAQTLTETFYGMLPDLPEACAKGYINTMVMLCLGMLILYLSYAQYLVKYIVLLQ